LPRSPADASCGIRGASPASYGPAVHPVALWCILWPCGVACASRGPAVRSVALWRVLWPCGASRSPVVRPVALCVSRGSAGVSCGAVALCASRGSQSTQGERRESHYSRAARGIVRRFPSGASCAARLAVSASAPKSKNRAHKTQKPRPTSAPASAMRQGMAGRSAVAMSIRGSERRTLRQFRQGQPDGNG
jgi:hypothetical protein